MDMEEENALLSRHVENMRTQIGRLEEEISNQTQKNLSLKEHVILLSEALFDKFSGTPIPGSDNVVPSLDTMEDYLKELEIVVAKQPDQHAELVAMAAEVVSDLELLTKEEEEEEKEKEEKEEGDGEKEMEGISASEN